ncbi:TraI/MobA(P) family conjugative relaxase [Thalassospira sp.]|uniref:TraI/MobA(P) family conjugative relaxase n=1 Tax=Thalassospira sp. TaxID=1912094 RepID=UPI00273302EB|nr:TraI/MobA(P) family conjugative relaxase [Thalassospira sp.]MDP2699922.1 TraI/MobA(P) family conjugative relaxase [Thalassospira sp.]
MITKKIPKDPDKPDNFKALAEYIAAAKEPGEKLDKFWIANCGAGETLDDLDLAILEVNAVRRLKPNVDDKTYHMMVSFRPGEKERLSEQDLKDIAKAYIDALGFSEHQYVAGTHTNTDNFHMHLAINKVHPATLQVVSPSHDYRKRDRVSRELEKKYGLFVDKGKGKHALNQPKLSPSARTYETHTWQESFQNHVLQHREAILEKINDAEAWADLHKTLAEYDIELKKRGNGFVLVGPDGQGMKASALDRSMSKAALEKKLGDFEPPAAQIPRKDALPPRPRHRYKKRPTMRHPRLSPLWRRYLNIRQPEHKRSTFLRRTISNWKLFLLSEAYKDPLIVVFLLAQQEFLHLVFGDDKPTPVSKLAAPALAAWRNASQWADAKSLNWIAETRSTGRGCRLDEEGNLIVPFKDENGFMQLVRLYSPDGKTMQIGNTNARGLTHIIDTRKQIESGPVIFVSDYADGVKIHDATRRPVVVVADPKELRQVIGQHRYRNPTIRPVVLAGNDASSQPGIRKVAMPHEDDVTEIRRAFAHAIGDDAFIEWDACKEWATPGNSPWLKAAGLRGYGVKNSADGSAAVPLKDRSGRIENVMLIDKKGKQSLVLDADPERPLYHTIDPQWRSDKDTIVIARDYADAAAIHRATRCPVVVPERPDLWSEVAEQVRQRFNDAQIVVALDAVGNDDDEKKANKLAVEIVRPARAVAFKEYAAREPDKPGSRLLAFGIDHYDFNPEKSESGYAKLQGPDGAERVVWGVDIADAVEASGAKPGDWISLDIAKKKEVTVEERYRDKNGQWQTRTVQTHRNIWKAVILPDPETVPSMITLRNELALPVSDDGWTAWQAATLPDKEWPRTRPEIGSVEAWRGYRVDQDGNVLVPLRGGGNRLAAVYRLDSSGTGEIIAGAGGDKGLHHVVGGRISKDKDEPILIADDLTSAIELNRITKKPVVWSIDSENLKAVGESLRRLHPDRNILFAAMDAHMAIDNRPLAHAKQAASAINGDVMLPPLSDQDRKRNSMSFADLLKSGQIEAVRTALKEAGIEGDGKKKKPEKDQSRKPRGMSVSAGPGE